MDIDQQLEPMRRTIDTDIDRRLRRLEGREEKITEAMQELVISSKHVNDVLVELKETLPRLRQLETQLAMVSTVMSIIKWVSGTVVATAITMALAFLFGASSGGNL